VAEKLHPIVQHGLLNSRMKDIYDVQALAAGLAFDGASLAEAIRLTLERCGRRLPPEAWLIFLDDLLAGVYSAEPPTGADLARCRELQARYADLALGVVDASIVALAERLAEPKVATLDQRHFRALRPAHVEALELRP